MQITFTRTAKRYTLTDPPCPFGIFFEDGGISLAGYTPTLPPSAAQELCKTILIASVEAEGVTNAHNRENMQPTP